jgi:catechol 2,3-dioxygenase-like lactoylglutathione lyase family enzyme
MDSADYAQAMATGICTCCGETAETVQLHAHNEIRICYNCLDWLNRKRDSQIKGHGGGWQVAGFEPIFMVTDITRSTDHYATMGFEIDFHDETYAFAHRDRDLTIHLTLEAQPAPGKLYIHCDDAGEMAEEWRKAGLEVDGPRDYDYGKREGSHLDPDGNLIRFGSPIRPDSN